MATWKPDPTFYPSPRMAMKAPAEKLAYVAAFDPSRKTPDGIAVVDLDPNSKHYSTIRNTVAMPNVGDELHHFGWNACSSCLCPNAPHPHIERRYRRERCHRGAVPERRRHGMGRSLADGRRVLFAGDAGIYLGGAGDACLL